MLEEPRLVAGRPRPRLRGAGARSLLPPPALHL